MGRAGLLFSIGIRCFFGFGILVSCSMSNSKGCCTCQVMLFLVAACSARTFSFFFSANDSWACAGLAQLTDHYASVYVQHQSPVNCILLCESRLSLLYTMADTSPHYTYENCSCASHQYVLNTHGTLTNRLCGAMQLLWILGPIALLIATMATLSCFFWMDFLPTPSRAQLHLLKSSDEHE